MAYQFRPERVRFLAQEDSDRVRRYAQMVIEIRDGKLWGYRNTHSGLGILAVVGPAVVAGVDLPSVVLCEIGLGKSRPYHQARVPREQINRLGIGSITRRRRLGVMSPEQYQLVAPSIFKLLQDSADARVGQWKSGPLWQMFVTRNYYTGAHGWEGRNKVIECLRGARFCVARADTLLLEDIYWAERNHPSLQKRLRSLARFIDKCLSRYRSGYRRSFEKLCYVQRIREMLTGYRQSWLPPRLMLGLIEHIPRGTKNPLYTETRQLISEVAGSVVDGSPQPLADPAGRLNGIQLVTIQPRDGQSRDHIVFEVFSRSEPS